MTRLEYRLLVENDKGDSNVNSIAIDRNLPKEKLPQGLKISFRRTIRVPDNKELSKLPPGLGSFPLYRVQDYAARLPPSMVDKGGVFFPMHQREAMWINFKASAPFMIKIYCGGVNVVSGEHAAEGAETKQRRAKLLEQGELIQDYVVVPEQPWLDGVAIKPSVVRQFFAIPLGQGYTVEAQLTGKEVVGGLTFEITPALCEIKDLLTIYMKTLLRKTIVVRCSPDDSIYTVKCRLHDLEGIPPDQLRLIHAGKSLDREHQTLSDYNIQERATLVMVLRLRGGGPLPKPSELGVAVGGLIKQDVRKDFRDPQQWIKGLTMVIPVQILDSTTFFQATGREPPECPVDAETPTDVSGAEAFGDLQSVNEIDMARGQADGHEPAVHPPVTKLRGNSLGTTVWNDGEVFHIEDPDGLLSPSGPRRDFRTLTDLEGEIKGLELESKGDEMVG